MRRLDVPGSALVQLGRVHDSIDRSSARIAELHRGRLRCQRGCHDCCVDGLAVSVAEAALIARAHPELLASEQPAAPGRCAMLAEDGSCRVYLARPYVCRTQGLPLRWRDETGTERRDICPLNDEVPGVPRLEDLPPEACWTLGGAERALALVDGLAGGGGERVPLRDLFGGVMMALAQGIPPETAAEAPPPELAPGGGDPQKKIS